MVLQWNGMRGTVYAAARGLLFLQTSINNKFIVFSIQYNIYVCVDIGQQSIFQQATEGDFEQFEIEFFTVIGEIFEAFISMEIFGAY